MNNDLISVVMPYYKKISFVEGSINSVLGQTYKNIEIIIIYDDTDLTDYFYIKKIFSKKNIRIIINKKNMGAAYSRNIGVRKSKGKYIAFLDCDDLWNKNKVNLQYNFMKNNQYSFSYCSYNEVNIKNVRIRTVFSKKEINYNDLLYNCSIGLSTVMISRRIIELIKFPNLKTKEDFALWLALLRKGIKFYGINKVLVNWRNVPSSLSDSVYNKIYNSFRVYFYYENLSLIKSLFLVFFLSFNYIKKKITLH
jgi:teichuronic acid biosynthesis glycosyltransferase TuaG